MKKGLTAVDLSKNYFPNDDLTQPLRMTWRSAGQLRYFNWLNFYVYQSTLYDIGGATKARNDSEPCSESGIEPEF